MQCCLSDYDIGKLIEEDLPYVDLTTHLLGIGGQPGKITYLTRGDIRLCGAEEASIVLEKCGAKVNELKPSGTDIPADGKILSAEGTAQSLHSAWRIALNIIEYSSGIATRMHNVLERVKAVNPDATVFTTRKNFPGTKKLAIKAVLAGGGLPHRLGLSETILVFKQHIAFLGGLENFIKTIDGLKAKVPEKKIIVEAENPDEARMLAKTKVDIIQVDKLPSAELDALIKELKQINPNAKVSAAGGINENNAAEYAATGLDSIILSSVYFGKPADIGVKITPAA